MMITDQMATALAGILAASHLPHSPTVQTGVSTTETEEESARVVVIGMAAQLRKPSLPGIYDVAGEVTIYQHIIDASAESNFRETCEGVRHVVGRKHALPSVIQQEDPKLYVYSWNLTGQENFNNGTRLGARFTWTACARQDPNNPN